MLGALGQDHGQLIGPGIQTQVSWLPAGAPSTQGGSSPAHEGQAGSDGWSGGLSCTSKAYGVNGDVSCCVPASHLSQQC